MAQDGVELDVARRQPLPRDVGRSRRSACGPAAVRGVSALGGAGFPDLRELLAPMLAPSDCLRLQRLPLRRIHQPSSTLSR